MKTILNKDSGTGGKRTTYEVKGTKQVFDKVGFRYNRNFGGLELALGVKGKPGVKGRRATKYLDKADNLCVLSIAGKNGQGKLDLLVGFYEKYWKSKTPIKVEPRDGLIGGYSNWCGRWAPKFDTKKKDLVVGISFGRNVTGAGNRKLGKGVLVSKVTYNVGEDSVGFIADVKKGEQEYWRICAEKPNEQKCAKDVYPVILGVVGNKRVTGSKFGTSSPVEDFSELFWGLSPKQDHKRVMITNPGTRGTRINIPVGVKPLFSVAGSGGFKIFWTLFSKS